MNVITSPGTYDTSQIDSFEHIYSLPITNTKNNPVLLNMVIAEYMPETVGITVLDDGALR